MRRHQRRDTSSLIPGPPATHSLLSLCRSSSLRRITNVKISKRKLCKNGMFSPTIWATLLSASSTACTWTVRHRQQNSLDIVSAFTIGFIILRNSGSMTAPDVDDHDYEREAWRRQWTRLACRKMPPGSSREDWIWEGRGMRGKTQRP